MDPHSATTKKQQRDQQESPSICSAGTKVMSSQPAATWLTHIIKEKELQFSAESLRKHENLDGWNHIFTSHTNYMSGHTHIQGDTSIGFSQKPDQSSWDQNPGKGNIIFSLFVFPCPVYLNYCAVQYFPPTGCLYNTKVSLVAFSSQCLYVRYILQHTSSHVI